MFLLRNKKDISIFWMKKAPISVAMGLPAFYSELFFPSVTAVVKFILYSDVLISLRLLILCEILMDY